MKILSTLLLACFFLFPAPAHGGHNGLTMLVIDQDSAGTNVRAAPGGAVVMVIPYGSKDEKDIDLRAVLVSSQREGDWFQVSLSNGQGGWMHRSVLGSCASATEDGDPTMYAGPDENSAVAAKVKDGTPLRLLEVSGIWAKMEFTGPGGRKTSGWMMEQCLFSNPHNSCHDK